MATPTVHSPSFQWWSSEDVRNCPYMSLYVCTSKLVGGFNPYEKYESQLGWLFPIYGKMKHVPNHHHQIKKYVGNTMEHGAGENSTWGWGSCREGQHGAKGCNWEKKSSKSKTGSSNKHGKGRCKERETWVWTPLMRIQQTENNGNFTNNNWNQTISNRARYCPVLQICS